MTKEELIYGLQTLSAAPIADVTQARAKAAWLVRIADELELVLQNQQAAGIVEAQ